MLDICNALLFCQLKIFSRIIPQKSKQNSKLFSEFLCEGKTENFIQELKGPTIKQIAQRGLLRNNLPKYRRVRCVPQMFDGIQKFLKSSVQRNRLGNALYYA